MTVLGAMLLAACTRCDDKALPASKQTRIHAVFTSSGPYEDGRTLSGEFVLNLPAGLAPGEKPGLLLTFHGDGRARAGLWNDPAALDRLARTGDRFKLITVALQEPHLYNWWEGKVGENVRYVDDFIQTYLMKHLAFDTRHVFLTGVSGGADFACCIFPPQTRYKYQGAALATCGGDSPEKMLTLPDVDLTVEMRRGMRFYFANVADDPDFPPDLVARTAAFYAGLGFPVHRVTVDHQSLDGLRDYGTGHCSFDIPGWRDRFLEMYFAAEP